MKSNLLGIVLYATLLLGTLNSDSYAMEYNVIQENNMLSDYKSITECLKSKCTQEEFDKIQNTVVQDYEQICNSYWKNNNVINNQDIALWKEILQNSKKILN